MNEYIYNITEAEAAVLALREAGLERADNLTAKREDGYWVLEFTANELRYTCYVDGADGTVPGLDFEPAAVESYPDDGVKPAAGVRAA